MLCREARAPFEGRCAVPVPRGQKAFCQVPGEAGAAGAACGMRRGVQQKDTAKSCRQVESPLDVFVSRGVSGSVGTMIFKYGTGREILQRT